MSPDEVGVQRSDIIIVGMGETAYVTTFGTVMATILCRTAALPLTNDRVPCATKGCVGSMKGDWSLSSTSNQTLLSDIS